MMSETPTEAGDVFISEDRDIPAHKIIALYAANGWSAATKPQELWNALQNPIHWFPLGLARSLSDSETLCRTDILSFTTRTCLLPSYQGRGIGGRILERLKLKYQGIHQHILVADGRAIEFYKKHGFETAGKTQSMWIYKGDDH